MAEHTCRNCGSNLSFRRVDTEKFVTGELAHIKTLKFWFCLTPDCRFREAPWLDQEMININIAEAFFRVVGWAQENGIKIPKEVISGNQEEAQHRSRNTQNTPQIDVGGSETGR